MNLPKILSFLVASALPLIIISCKKKSVAPAPPPQTQPMGFTKNMGQHGTYELEGDTRYACWLCTPPEDTTYPAFEEINIEVLNDSNIYLTRIIPGRLFTYDRATSESNVYTCRECDGYYERASITYYFHKDSIVYYSYGRTSGNSYEKTVHTL